MEFANPAALWLLLLLPLPLLLSRKRPRARHLVSNIYLWRAALRSADAHVVPRRVRSTWLAFVQMACIAVIALSIARPLVAIEPRLTAFVFDVSASMAARDRGATRLDAARARARAIAGALPRFARIRVVLAAGSPRTVGEWSASDPLLLATIETLAPTGGTADVAGAIELAGGDGNVSSIIVFGDTDVATARRGPDSPPVQSVRVGGAVANTAVLRVAVRRTELGGRSGQAFVVLRSYGVTPHDADVEVAVDGRIVARHRVQLLAAGLSTFNVELGDVGHWVTARVVSDDALRIDDSRSVAVPLENAIRVAFSGPRGSFLERALAVNPSLLVRTYDQDATLQDIGSLADIDVLVCERCSSSRPVGIPSLVVAGGSGSALHDVLRVVNATHPVAESLEPAQQTATVYSSTTADPRADVVLRVGTVSAVTAAEVEGQRSVGIHLDLTEPDFVLSAAFPVLVANSVGWLAGQHTIPSDVTAGEPLALTLPTGASHEVGVVGPDGLPRDVRHVGARFIISDTDAPGQYRIHVNGSEHLVAVNPDVAAESNLSVTQTGSPTGTEPVSARARVVVGRWLALFGVGLLALEWRLRMQGA
jgi:Aerotolerance regulator N-terminal/von Willebrand factor type A domain